MTETLYIVKGPIGGGKTSLSRALHDRLDNNASLVEVDGIKRMLDSSGSSEWRRNIANDSALFIIDRLLQVPRSGIIETHTKYPDVLLRLADVALRNNAQVVSILVKAPLSVCIDRAYQRHTPDISYVIDETMVSDYYCNLDPLEGDLVFDSTELSPAQMAEEVVSKTNEYT